MALGAGGVEDPPPGSILKAEFSDLCEGLAGGFLLGRNEHCQYQLGCGPAPSGESQHGAVLETPLSALAGFRAMANTKHFILEVNFFIEKEGRERGMEGGREGERKRRKRDKRRKKGKKKERVKEKDRTGRNDSCSMKLPAPQ